MRHLSLLARSLFLPTTLSPAVTLRFGWPAKEYKPFRSQVVTTEEACEARACRSSGEPCWYMAIFEKPEVALTVDRGGSLREGLAQVWTSLARG